MRNIRILAATAIVLAIAAPAEAKTYALTPYAVPGSTFTQLWGLNDHGVLVGADDSGGFIDDHGTITVVNQPGTSGFVTGISNTGVAVGGDGTRSYFYQGGVFTPFAIAGADTTTIRGISANGRFIAGVYTTADTFDGFVYDTQTSALSTIVPPNGINVTVVQGVTDSGVAVGSLTGPDSSFLFDAVNGTSTYYTDVGGLTKIRIRGIDDAGDVGGWSIGTDAFVGFLGSFADGFTTFDLSPDGTFIYGLNNVGEAVGYYDDDDGLPHSFLVNTTTVPEPSSTASMALALLVAGARLARRRKTG